MNKLLLILLSSLLALATACQPGGTSGNDKAGEDKTGEDETGSRSAADPGADAPPATLAFEQQQFRRQSSSCEQDSSHCAEIDANYPLAVGGPEAAVRNINDTITAYVRTSLAVFSISPEETPQSLDMVAREFLEEYEAILSEQGNDEPSWSIELDGQVLYQSKRVVSVELSTYSYTGGAHPNSFVYLLNFDAQTGAALSLNDLVRDTVQLRGLAEAAFRQARELEPAESLSDAGFFWGEPFALPENYALTEDGLYLYYNPYEVAAYVFGPTSFTIGRESLAGLLKEQ